jgi:hypothetical protein
MSPEADRARDALFAAAEALDTDTFITAFADVLRLPDPAKRDEIRDAFAEAFAE